MEGVRKIYSSRLFGGIEQRGSIDIMTDCCFCCSAWKLWSVEDVSSYGYAEVARSSSTFFGAFLALTCPSPFGPQAIGSQWYQV